MFAYVLRGSDLRRSLNIKDKIDRPYMYHGLISDPIAFPSLVPSDDEKGRQMWRKYLEREDSRIGGECMSLSGACQHSGPSLHTHTPPPLRRALPKSWDPGRRCERSCTHSPMCPPDLFVGQLKSSLTCTDCGYCSTVFDPFWDLSLPIAKVVTLTHL